jgi:hypothetical protein
LRAILLVDTPSNVRAGIGSKVILDRDLMSRKGIHSIG